VTDDIETAVVGYFKAIGDLPVQGLQETLDFAYVPGFLDSFATIEFVIWLEETFHVRLSQEQLQSEQFRTIGGVIELVRQLKASRGPLD